MKLPIPFIKNKKEKTEYYLALLLTDDKVTSVILEEERGKIKIVGHHKESLSDSIETVSLEELINIVDKTVSRAEEVLPPNIETHKTVFGVKEDWVGEEKKIKKEYLAKLKKVCDALDLSPLGFMVTTEAITHLLQDEEGAPLSAIIVDISSKKVALTLLRGGRVIESTDGPFEGSASATVDVLLRNFTIPVLPARIIILPTDDSEKLKQHFISHHWSKSLPFAHMPQIVILPVTFDIRAVTFGAAAQMGFGVLDTGSKAPETLEVPQEINEEVDLNPPPY